MIPRVTLPPIRSAFDRFDEPTKGETIRMVGRAGNQIMVLDEPTFMAKLRSFAIAGAIAGAITGGIVALLIELLLRRHG